MFRRHLANPLARYLIGDPESELRRKLLALASIGGGLTLTLTVLSVVVDLVGLNFLLAFLLWSGYLMFPSMVATRASRLAQCHIGTEKYDLLRMTHLSPRQIIEGFTLAGLYRFRRLGAPLYGSLPAALIASFHFYVWFSGGMFVGPDFDPLSQLAYPRVWLRLPILLGVMLSTAALTLPASANKVWGRMSKARAEYAPTAADLGVALSLWGLTFAQITAPLLAFALRAAGRAELVIIMGLVVVALLLPVGQWMLGLWMLRMADERL